MAVHVIVCAVAVSCCACVFVCGQCSSPNVDLGSDGSWNPRLGSIFAYNKIPYLVYGVASQSMPRSTWRSNNRARIVSSNMYKFNLTSQLRLLVPPMRI